MLTKTKSDFVSSMMDVLYHVYCDYKRQPMSSYLSYGRPKALIIHKKTTSEGRTVFVVL